MKIVRVPAVQAHAVPKRVHEPRGPFPDELFDEPEIVYDYEPAEDEGHSSSLPGATAQNNFKPEKQYRCRVCMAKVPESGIEDHVCE